MRFRRALAAIVLSTAVPGVAAAQSVASGARQVDIAYEITFAGLSGFRIDLKLKDLRLVNEAAFEMGVPLPATALATQLYLEARAHGEGSNGNQALYRVYDRLSSQEG